MYNTAFWVFCSGQQALCGPNVSPRVLYKKDTLTMVDKDANFTILTSEMYRKVNELKAENWREQKK